MRIVTISVIMLLGVAAALAMIRVARGPSILDRMVAIDGLLVVVVGGLGAEAAYRGDVTTLPLLVVLSVLGFTASTVVARFVGGRDAPDARGSSAGRPPPGGPFSPDAADPRGNRPGPPA